MKYHQWACLHCDFVYHEKVGLVEEGILPNTAWADIPDDWVCPDCGVGKSEFEIHGVSEESA